MKIIGSGSEDSVKNGSFLEGQPCKCSLKATAKASRIYYSGDYVRRDAVDGQSSRLSEVRTFLYRTP